MKVLITGGSGFIGSFFAEKFMREGAEVSITVFSDHENKNVEFLKSLGNLSILSGDLTDPAFAKKAVAGQELIIHTAAIKKNIEFHRLHPALILRANALIDLNVLEAAKDSDLKPRMLMIGSVVAENIDPNTPHFGYAWSKKYTEILAEAYAREYGLKIAVVRGASVFGPRDNFDEATAQVIPKLISQISRGAAFDRGPSVDAKKSFVYAEDFVEQALKILEESKNSEPVLISSPESISINDLMDLIIALKNKTDVNHSWPILESGLSRTIEWYAKMS